MNEIDLRLAHILQLELSGCPDWEEIGRECLEVIRSINEDQKDYLGTVGYRFVEDFDVRQKSPEYGNSQREELRQWLERRSRFR